MSAHPSFPTATPPGHQQAADTRYHRDVLHELIDLGMVLARAVQANALAQAQAAPDAPDPTVPFDRIARCVRRTVLLARHIAEPPRPTLATAARNAARRHILRAVEDTIDRHTFRTRAPSGTDALHAELNERLDSQDLDDDLATRPVADIITDIVRDLGIDFEPPGVCPSRRRPPGAVAALHARAAAAIGAAPPTPPAPPPMLPRPGDPGADLAGMVALCTMLAPDG